MTETEFHHLADLTITAIERGVEASQDEMGWVLDWENHLGVLTIIIESNQSQIIISRQPSIAELWVAAKSGGYHFTYDGNQWKDKNDITIEACISNAILDQSGVFINL